MRYLKILLLSAVQLAHATLLADEPYRYYVDLVAVDNDKVMVTLDPPDLAQEEADFLFPAMVPGTYEVYDFGRFISGLKVTGRNGAIINVKRIDVNTYRLSPATQIDRITYLVDDTFDKTDLPGTERKVIFEPGGTGFERGKYFTINTHSMFGYLGGLLDREIIVEFRKPKGFYPATGLTGIQTGDTTDVISAPGYHALADSPILYAAPDTVSLGVANATVMVACYSPNRQITARFIAETLEEVLLAQRDYLGGTLPVSKYAFLFYFTDKPTLSGSSGALEHSYSSFYVLPEFDSLALKQQLRDIAAHEFFHIVTPLGIHSEEIGDFDFNRPKMSRHLWLYEGMTEYAAHHAQVRSGLINVTEFLEVMIGKYANSLERYNDTMSFTWMSRNVLDEKVHEQYGNVYEKGAVISMCLDILLRDLSNGSYGTRELMRDLSRKYGKDKSFRDEELFKEIEALTYPEAGEFLRRHVEGKTPLPMEDIFKRVGINFAKEVVSYEFSLGNPGLNFNPDSMRLYVESTDDLDAFGKALRYRRGDQLYRLNGKVLTMERLKDVIADFYQNVKEGDKVEVDVYRVVRGKQKLRTLSARAKKVKVVKKNQVSLVESLTEKQKVVMRSWLGLL